MGGSGTWKDDATYRGCKLGLLFVLYVYVAVYGRANEENTPAAHTIKPRGETKTDFAVDVVRVVGSDAEVNDAGIPSLPVVASTAESSSERLVEVSPPIVSAYEQYMNEGKDRFWAGLMVPEGVG